MTTATKTITVKAAAPVKTSPAAKRPTMARKVVAKARSETPTVAPKPSIDLVTAAAALAPRVERVVKPKKPKLVRDSFTIPKTEYAALDELKQRSHKIMQPAKKSELLRAGIKTLAALSDDALLAALQAVPAIKTGRPAKD